MSDSRAPMGNNRMLSAARIVPRIACRMGPFVLVAGLGCDTTQDHVMERRATVVDSAGVSLITHPAALLTCTAYRLGASTLLITGDEAGGELLFRVGDVATLSTGEVAVANGGSKSIMIFDRQGRLTRELGGPGEGPGRFGATNWLAQFRDSLWVHDTRYARSSVFHLDGSFARQVRFAPGDRVGLPRPIGFLPDGSVLTIGNQTPRDDNGYQFAHQRPDGAVLHALPGLAGPSTPQLVRTGDRHFIQADVFAPHGHAGVIDSLIAHFRATTYELSVLAPNGTLITSHRIDAEPVLLREGDVEELLESLGGLVSQATPRGEMDLPDRLPAFGRSGITAQFIPQILEGTSGEIWVLLYDLSATPQRWVVFGPETNAKGLVTLFAGFELREIHADHVLGIHRDSLGVETVRALQLLPSTMKSDGTC